MSSQGVVVMNALSMLWSSMDTIIWRISLQIGGEKFPRKMENAKMTGIDWLSVSKDTKESWDIDRSLWCGVRVGKCLLS